MNIRLRKIDTDPKAMSEFVGFGPQPCALRAFGALRAFVAYGRLWFVFWTQSEILNLSLNLNLRLNLIPPSPAPARTAFLHWRSRF